MTALAPPRRPNPATAQRKRLARRRGGVALDSATTEAVAVALVAVGATAGPFLLAAALVAAVLLSG